MKQGILGVALFFVGLWGVSWAFNAWQTQWMGFPATITSAVFCVIGVVVAVFGFSKETEFKI